jgi:hypothetical protein
VKGLNTTQDCKAKKKISENLNLGLPDLRILNLFMSSLLYDNHILLISSYHHPKKKSHFLTFPHALDQELLSTYNFKICIKAYTQCQYIVSTEAIFAHLI